MSTHAFDGRRRVDSGSRKGRVCVCSSTEFSQNLGVYAVLLSLPKVHVFVCRGSQHTKGERRLAPHKACLLIHTLWLALPSASQTSRAIPFRKSLGISLGLSSGVWALALSQCHGVSGLVVARRTTGILPKIAEISVTKGLSSGLGPNSCLRLGGPAGRAAESRSGHV